MAVGSHDRTLDGLHLKIPKYQILDGFRMPMGFPSAGLESGLKYQPGPDDIFVCSYPKCGTTWVQYIVYMLTHGGQSLPAGQTLATVFPHLEEVGRDQVAVQHAPRLIKTHLPRSMTPFGTDAKYIYVARNPFDCAVSFYHHTRGFVKHYDFADGSFDEFLECFLSGEVDFGDYFDHLLSFLPSEQDQQLLHLTYEATKVDPRATILAIGQFLGEHARESVSSTEMIDRIVKETSFDHMRQDQRRWSSERPQDMPEFVRKGVVGDWQSHFSPQLAQRLLSRFEQRTRGTAAAGWWSDILDAARLFANREGRDKATY